MKKDILSLKSLYQFLVISDYPVFCPGIITKNNHKGLTLTKFWREMILIDFRNQKCGKLIWREAGGRNRFVSDICNRSERITFYREYAEEIYGALKPETILRQIRQFMSFLLERQFNYDAFIQKLPAYIEYAANNDVFFSKDAHAFFEKEYEKRKSFEGQGNGGRAFFCGYLLTFLMLHAIMGNGEGETILGKLRKNQGFSIEELKKQYLQEYRKEQKKVVFLTAKNTELCSNPLTSGHFFGRETELFELRQMLVKGGKYVVSGIGGIGKTELMRQLLKCCEEEKLVDYICVIQYENSLVDSLIKAFPEIRGSDREGNFKEALARIRLHAREKVLIVIDNMVTSLQDEQELDRLCGLEADIFITSRHRELSGFETFEINPLKKDACRLVFRDNYGKQLTEEDKAALDIILSRDIWQHTLTLRLLGCVAGTRGWSVPELLERLQKGEKPVSLKGEAGYESLRQLYRRMYAVSGLKRDVNKVLQAFALLPYESYSVDFARKYMQGFMGEGIEPEQSLMHLWKSGWLEKKDDGYSLHPFIAECVLAKRPGETEFAPFLESVILSWTDGSMEFDLGDARRLFDRLYDDWKETEKEQIKATLLALSAAKKLKGSFRDRTLQLLLFALEAEYLFYGSSMENLHFLVSLKTRCKGISACTKVYLYRMLCSYGYEDIRELEEEYRIQLANPEIPEGVKCAYAGELGERYGHLGDFERAEEMANYIWEKNAEPTLHIKACYIKADLAVNKGDFPGYEEWLKRGIEIGKESGREKSNEIEELTGSLCGLYLAMRKFEEAEDILKEKEALLDGDRTYFLRWKILFYRGSLSMYREDEGGGVQSLFEAYSLAESLFAGREDDIYAASIQELAMACNKVGKREEAEVYYKKALAIFEMIPGFDFQKCRILINMSVMYLDWEKPEEALDCLTKAEPAGKEMGGLTEAELNNNFSRTWRMLGDREKELEYLKKAVPVLEQFYGSGHPKVEDAKLRIEKEKA